MRYVAHEDGAGYVDTIDDWEGNVVLHLNPGTERNAQNAKSFVEQLNATATELAKLREEKEDLRLFAVKDKATIEDLRFQLEAAEKERDRLSVTIETTSMQRDAMREKLKAAEETAREDREHCESLNQQCGRAEADLAAAREQRDDLHVKVSVAEDEASELRCKLIDAEKRAEEAEAEVAELKQEREIAAGGPEAVKLPDPTPERTAQTNAIRRVVLEPGLIGRLEAERDELRAEVREEERICAQVLEERDHANEALKAAHRALGGDGEWVAKPGQECAAGSTGDLAVDVPALAEKLRAEVERLKADLAAACDYCGSDDPDMDAKCPLFVAQRQRDAARELVGKMREAMRMHHYARLSNPHDLYSDQGGPVGAHPESTLALIREADALLGEGERA